MNKYLIIPLFCSQFIIFPYFYNFNINAKYISIVLLLLSIIIFNKIEYIKINRFTVCLSIIFIFLLFSTLVSSQAYTSLLSLTVILVFIIYLQILLKDKSFSELFIDFRKYYLIYVTIISCFGLYQYFYYIFVGKSSNALIPYLLPPASSIRISGIFGQPNILSLVLILGILLFLYHYIHPSYDEFSKSSNLKYIPFVTIVLVFFLTGSRAGLLAFFLSIIYLIWMVNRKKYLSEDRGRKKQFIYLICIIFVTYIFSLILNTFFSLTPTRGISDVGISTDARFIFWTVAFLIFLDHPLFGIGLDNYKFYMSKYLNQAHDMLGFVQYDAMGYTKWAHNEYLQLLCEGGIFVFIIIISVTFLYFYHLFCLLFIKEKIKPLMLYSYVFLLPFIIQAFFEYPLRHPSTLFIFFIFFAIFISQFESKKIYISNKYILLIKLFSIILLFYTLMISYQEIKMWNLYSEVHRSNRDSFLFYENLSHNFYSEYTILSKFTPYYINMAIKNFDVDLAEKIEPYLITISEMEGAHWQWYNLALISHMTGKGQTAKDAIERAIYLRPTEQSYWTFQHYLNMLNASEKTGRPLEEFLPIPPGGSADDILHLFTFPDGSPLSNKSIPIRVF